MAVQKQRSIAMTRGFAACMLLLAAVTASSAEPEPPAAQTLAETQKRLDSTDPTVRYPAYDAALSSPDTVLRNLALSRGFASNDAAVRAIVLASVFERLRTLAIELSPPPAIAAELQSANQPNGRQTVSEEARRARSFFEGFGNVVTINILGYDKKSQSFFGVVPDHVEQDRVKNKDFSIGSLAGETLQLSVKLQEQGSNYFTMSSRVLCTVNLTLNQGGVLTGPASCSGWRSLPRGTGRLKVY